MIQITLRQLAYFVATAEAGSTRRAAETLNVSQPAISVAIGQLEDHYQQKLFLRRHAQGVELTSFGRRKLVEARHLLAYASSVASPGSDGTLGGELELGVFSTFAPFFAPALLKAAEKTYPNIRVRMRELDLDGIRRDLDRGMIELALLYNVDNLSSMSREVLASFSPYALLPATHPLASAPHVSLRDLARAPFVVIDLPHSRDYFLSLFRAAGVEPGRVINCSSFETLRGMVANGLGTSVLVTRPAGDISYDGKPLVCRPLSDAVPSQQMVLGWSDTVPLTPVAEAFANVARAYFAQDSTAPPPA